MTASEASNSLLRMTLTNSPLRILQIKWAGDRSPARNERLDIVFGLQAEHDQLTSVGRHLGERMTEQRAVVTRYVAAPTGDNGNVLLALGHVGDHATVVADTVVMPPQFLAGTGIQSVEVSIGARHEHQVALGRQQRSERRILELDAPLDLA